MKAIINSALLSIDSEGQTFIVEYASGFRKGYRCSPSGLPGTVRRFYDSAPRMWLAEGMYWFGDPEILRAYA